MNPMYITDKRKESMNNYIFYLATKELLRENKDFTDKNIREYSYKIKEYFKGCHLSYEIGRSKQ